MPSASDGVRAAGSTLRSGDAYSDFAQDYVGARAVASRSDAYPVLATAFEKVGVHWPVQGYSTHPPTAFLVALPVSWLPWRDASFVWAWLMVAGLVVAVWGLGCSWVSALALAPLILLWQPADYSLGQLTVIWLAAQAVAWGRWRDKPGRAGVILAIATAVKLLPIVLLVPFLIQRQWRAVTGFMATGVGLLLLLLVLDPQAFPEYLTRGRRESRITIARQDNGALLPWLHHTHGRVGVLFGGLLVVTVIGLCWKTWRGWVWLSLALLPIAWVYSLLPALEVMASSLRSRRMLATVLVVVALYTSSLSSPFGNDAANAQARFLVVLGIAVLASARSRRGHDELLTSATTATRSPSTPIHQRS